MALYDSYTTRIDSDEVRARISELEGSKGTQYVVYRTRNDEVLSTFDDEEDAAEFIEDEDYNPERVKVRQQEGELDDADAEELQELNELNAEGERDIDDWNFGIALIREDAVDEDYAKEEARSQLRFGFDLDVWPFTYIDWADAASGLLEGRDYVRFKGSEFYAL